METSLDLRILTTQYSLKERRLDLFVSGCKHPHCDGCFNPEAWRFDIGIVYGKEVFDNISSCIENFDSFGDAVRGIGVMGGEPLDQPHEKLYKMLIDLSFLKKEIWLFTHYSIDEVPTNIKSLCSYIKTGRFDVNRRTESNIQYGIKLASSNQKIYKRGVDY